MAIGSTGFMAAPGGYGSALADKLDKVDCSQVLAAVLKADKALLGHIKMGPVAHNIEVNWIEDELNAIVFSGRSADTLSVSVDGFTGTASLEAVCRVGAIIALKDNNPTGADFHLKVTSVLNESVLHTDVYGTVAWVSVTASLDWYVVAQPMGDTEDASTDISLERSKRRNFMQVFERAVEITQTRKGMDMEAVSNELQLQIKRRTLEIKRELDMSLINGIAYTDGSNYTAVYGQRTFMGIIAYIRDPDFNGTREDTTVTDVDAALKVTDINGLLYKIWDAGGLDESADPIIVVGASQQRVIAAMESDLRRVEQGERQVGFYRDIFMSDMGVECPIVLDRWMPTDKLLVLDRSRVAFRPMAGDQWHMEKMAKTGRTEKWQISGQYTVELRNPDQCHGLLIDLS